MVLRKHSRSFQNLQNPQMLSSVNDSQYMVDGFGVGKLEVDDCRIWELLNPILNSSSIPCRMYFTYLLSG